MKWLRYWTEALHDPKVQQLPAETFRRWVNLLCVASENTPRGNLPRNIAATAFALRISPAEADETVRELIAAGLIDELRGALRMHNWKNRQPKSDNVSERVKKHRENQKQAVPRNVTETPPEGEERRGETEAEEEADTEGEAEARAGASADPPRAQVIAQEWAVVQRAYEEHIGPLLPAAQQRLGVYTGQLPKEWVLAAIEDTGKARDPGWPYLDRILSRCQATSSPPSSTTKRGRAPPAGSAKAQMLDRYKKQLEPARSD